MEAAANDNEEEMGLVHFPEEHLRDVLVCLWDYTEHNLTLPAFRWRYLPLLREMTLPEDIMWQTVIQAMEWLGTLNKAQKQEIWSAYNSIRLVS